MSKRKVLAVTCGDVHLSAKPPAARAGEPDWFEAQARPLKELARVAACWRAAVLIAGDIFDKWNPAAELVNFALRHIPRGAYCVPGQHDLPYHDYDLMHRSGYGSLVLAGHVHDLTPPARQKDRGIKYDTAGEGTKWFSVVGFPWGFPPAPVERPGGSQLHVALCHRYVWSGDATSYPGAPEEAKAGRFNDALRGYDVAVFGDNHKPFECVLANGCTVFNGGGLMRRKSDDEFRPSLGILYDDGEVGRHYLDTTRDVWEPTADDDRPAAAPDGDLSDFVRRLEAAGGDPLDFRDALRRYAEDNVRSKEARRLLLDEIDGR